MVKPQNKSQSKEIIKASLRVIDYFFTEQDGMVIIYEVIPRNEMETFYIVSFDDTSTEVPWGMGYTPEEAIQDAANKWNLKSDTEEEKKENPFEGIIEQLKG